MAGEAQQRQQAESKIISKALTDSKFRDELKADPKGVLERELNVKLPANLKVNVVQEAPDSVYLVLPNSGGGQELSESELTRSTQMSDCWLTCTSCSEWTSFEPSDSAACG
jgi:hypothetical protein